jgi:hypothetical protein
MVLALDGLGTVSHDDSVRATSWRQECHQRIQQIAGKTKDFSAERSLGHQRAFDEAGMPIGGCLRNRL